MMALPMRSSGLPLFVWPEQVEIAAISEQRSELLERIGKLPRHAHRRVELEARLRELTERQLRLEHRMKRGAL